MKSHRFCPKPFEFLDIHLVDGRLMAYVCCRQWLPETIGDLSSSSPEEVWNSPKARELRLSMQDGSLKFCSEELCPEIQGNRLHDTRFLFTPRYREYLGWEQGVAPVGPRVVFFSEDRSCNLSCPSCRTSAFVLPPETVEQVRAARGKFMDWLLKDAREIGLSSGDPFASKIYRDFLFHLDGDRYPHLKININTNGLLFHPENWAKMEKIHGNIHCVFVSLDAARPETYRQVRRGGDWDTLSANLRFLSRLRKRGAIRYFRLDFVVQESNFAEMPDFVRLGKSLGADKVLFQRISNWGTFTAEEFRSKDIFSPGHPLHFRFREVCRQPALRSRIVMRGNVSSFIPPSFREKLEAAARRITVLRHVRARLKTLAARVAGH